MNTAGATKHLSSFGESAVLHDNDFSELERLSDEIGRIDIESDNGFKRAQKLLGHLGETGARIGTGARA